MAEGDEAELGGNIRLSGFRDVDPAGMVVAKKMIGNYMKRYEERCGTCELSVVLKPVHQHEENRKFEVQARVIVRGDNFTADVTDKNLFVAIDSALKKIESALAHALRDR